MGNDFRFEWNEKALRDLIKPAMDEIASDYSKEFEKLRIAHAGDSVQIIKPKVARIIRDHGGKATDAEIANYAKLISEGTQIKFKTETR